MRRILSIVGLAVLVAAGFLFWLSRPQPLPADAMAGLEGDAEHGRQVYLAAGCRSCHTAPESEDKDLLAGGQRFPSDFGTFLAPNISPHPEAGIGDWSLDQFASAVMRGVSPENRHYYPAFPYAAYARMDRQDVADLWAYWQTLPQSDQASAPHEVGFPFSIRRGLGLWKAMFVDPDWVMAGDLSPEEERGRYLAEALAHCGECHTPRGALGNLDTARWMAGAPDPSGKGQIPALTPDKLDWSAGDIAYYLESGFTPDYDSAGGHMVAVIDNFAELSPEDRTAVAAYVKALSEPAGE